MKVEPAKPNDFDALVELWERSARATHKFLSEDDIASLREDVRDKALPALDLWVIRDKNGAPSGFMGLHENSVEALFIDPDQIGRGLGKCFLDHARARHRSLKVDVNEQNPEALAFYESYGFVQTGRSETDSDGRPFPLLHLELNSASLPKGEGNDYGSSS